jgi:hypothetical protein
MMGSFTMADNNFNFLKHQIFTEEEIKQALQKGLENPTSPFTRPDGTSFDYSTFFGEDPKEAPNNTTNLKNEEDQPVQSIEEADPAADIPGTTQADVILDHHNDENMTATTQAVQNGQPTGSSGTEMTAITGLKNGSAGPLLFNMDNFDDLFVTNDQTRPPFGDNYPMQTLASPFQLPDQRADAITDFTLHNPIAGRMHTPTPNMAGHNRLAAHHFPTGRRRSQTVPPDFEPGMPFQRRVGNGVPVPHNRPMYPHIPRQSFPLPQHNGIHGCRMNGGYGPEAQMIGMPRSYPITPPPRHSNSMMMHFDGNGYATASRPQPLNPEIRMSLLSHTRDISPDRGRRVKRQKQNHDRPMPPIVPIPGFMPMDNEFGAYGMDQAMAAVEFLLRDTAEKVRYGREEEIEKYVCTFYETKRKLRLTTKGHETSLAPSTLRSLH